MNGNFSVRGPVPPAYGPGYPAPPSLKQSRAGVWLGSIACLLAAAALVVGVIALANVPQEPVSVPPPLDQADASPELFVDDADKALCKAVGPLMREETGRTTAFVDTGDPDSAARKAAIPRFQAETLEWSKKVQTLLKEYKSPSRYLTRTLQGYVDGMLLYTENLHDDRAPDPFDNATYEAAVVALGGPLATCYKLGAGW